MNLVIPKFRGAKRQQFSKLWFSKEKCQTKMIGSRKALKAVSDPQPSLPLECSMSMGQRPDDDDQLQQPSYGSPNHYSEIFWVYVTNE